MLAYIKKTRIKFAIIIVLLMAGLLGALLINLNITMDKAKDRNINEILDKLVADYENNITVKLVNNNEYFVIKVDEDNKIIDSYGWRSELSKEELRLYMDSVEEINLKNGEIKDFRYKIQKTDYGHVIAFVNMKMENIMLKDLKDESIKIAAIGIIIIVILSYILSKIVLKPLETAIKKQKDFVSDASHELKTPLSIIKINASLLKGKDGGNEYLDEVDSQVDRMSDLVNELLMIAKIENPKNKAKFVEINLSKIILRTILQLDVIAYENGKEIKHDIAENLIHSGIEKDIVKMIDALIDNAIKYSKDKSEIYVDLKSSNDNKILKISNESYEITKEECVNIFDGFYRMDKSRNSHAEGFGIGLSVVKNIVLNHGGNIEAYYEDGLFTIEIVF